MEAGRTDRFTCCRTGARTYVFEMFAATKEATREKRVGGSEQGRIGAWRDASACRHVGVSAASGEKRIGGCEVSSMDSRILDHLNVLKNNLRSSHVTRPYPDTIPPRRYALSRQTVKNRICPCFLWCNRSSRSQRLFCCPPGGSFRNPAGQGPSHR
jgi:hypothetical protein